MEKESLELKNRRLKNAAETLCEDWGRRDLFSGVCMVTGRNENFSESYNRTAFEPYIRDS